MPIVVNLDVMLAKRKMNLTELSFRVGITIANMSILKSGKAKAIRFSTLDEICKVLNCQPGDLLEYMDEDSYKQLMGEWCAYCSNLHQHLLPFFDFPKGVTNKQPSWRTNANIFGKQRTKKSLQINDLHTFRTVANCIQRRERKMNLKTHTYILLVICTCFADWVTS